MKYKIITLVLFLSITGFANAQKLLDERFFCLLGQRVFDTDAVYIVNQFGHSVADSIIVPNFQYKFKDITIKFDFHPWYNRKINFVTFSSTDTYFSDIEIKEMKGILEYAGLNSTYKQSLKELKQRNIHFKKSKNKYTGSKYISIAKKDNTNDNIIIQPTFVKDNVTKDYRLSSFMFHRENGSVYIKGKTCYVEANDFFNQFSDIQMYNFYTMYEAKELAAKYKPAFDKQQKILADKKAKEDEIKRLAEQRIKQEKEEAEKKRIADVEKKRQEKIAFEKARKKAKRDSVINVYKNVRTVWDVVLQNPKNHASLLKLFNKKDYNSKDLEDLQKKYFFVKNYSKYERDDYKYNFNLSKDKTCISKIEIEISKNKTGKNLPELNFLGINRHMSKNELIEKFGKEYKKDIFAYVIIGSTGKQSNEKNRFKIKISSDDNRANIWKLTFEPISPTDFEITNDFTLIPTGCVSGDCYTGTGTFAYSTGEILVGQFFKGNLQKGEYYQSEFDTEPFLKEKKYEGDNENGKFRKLFNLAVNEIGYFVSEHNNAYKQIVKMREDNTKLFEYLPYGDEASKNAINHINNAMTYLWDAKVYLKNSGLDCSEADNILHLMWKDCLALERIENDVIRRVLSKNGVVTQEEINRIDSVDTIISRIKNDHTNALNKALKNCGFF